MLNDEGRLAVRKLSMAANTGWTRLACVGLAVLVASSCATRRPRPTDKAAARATVTNAPPAAAGATNAPAATERPKIKFDATHDAEIQEVFALVDKEEWETAELKSLALVEEYPNDPALNRLYTWVADRRKVVRERAIEDRIRQVEAKNSPFNPTVVDLFTEEKNRGLTPRKDLRDQ